MGTRQHFLAAAIAAGLVFSTTAAEALRLVKNFDYGDGRSGTIDYEGGFVEATAVGTADTSRISNPIQAESVARRTSRHLAYEVLAETVGQIQVDAKTLYQDAMAAMDALKIETHAVIRGAQVRKNTFEWVKSPIDGRAFPKATTTLRLYLTGEEGLGHLLDKHVPPDGGFVEARLPPAANREREASPTPAPAAPAPPAAVASSAAVETSQAAESTGLAVKQARPANPEPTAAPGGEVQTAAAAGPPPSTPAPVKPEAAPATGQETAVETPVVAGATAQQPEPEPPAAPSAAPAATPAESPATEAAAPTKVAALVLDTRAVDPGYEPAMRVYVRDESGDLVYGPGVVRASIAREGRRPFRYASSPEEARSLFPADGQFLLVTPLKVEGPGDVVIREGDAAEVRAANQQQPFLRDARVVLVIQ